MDAYTNVLRHSGFMLVDMDALTVNSNHLTNDPARNPGRPRKRRIRSASEAGGNAAKAPKHRCSRCNDKGHHAATRSRLM